MSQVQGQVVLRSSRIGIPGLLVSVYEINPAGPPPCQSQADAERDRGDPEQLHFRLGSALTNPRGEFVFQYECQQLCGLNRKPRPDLMVVVWPPDYGCTERSPLACCFRRDAASVEAFYILVDDSRLQEAGIPIPGHENSVEAVIEGWHAATERQVLLRAESRRLFGAQLGAKRQVLLQAEEKFQTFLSALSANPAAAQGPRYVPRGTSVQAANQAVIQSGIEQRINEAAVVGIATLSDEQVSMFQDTVSGQEFDSVLWENQWNTGVLVKGTPLAFLCHEGPVDPCVDILEGKAPPEEPEPVPDEPPEPGDGETPAAPDIPLLIENLVQYMTPPESAKIFAVPNRADIEDVQKGVDGFMLHSGPADGPSLHDFHHLQIAFEHVWQELFDKGVVKKGKELYAELVEMGVDPNEYLIEEGEVVPDAVDFGGVNFSGLLSSEPDPEVISEFEITLAQWAVLAKPQQDALRQIASDITKLRGDRDEQIRLLSILEGNILIVVSGMSVLKDQIRMRFDYEIREKRRNGEMIVRYADHKLEAPKDFDHFHKNLFDLKKALQEPYRFSIYAANREGRSVNFGVVVTYRQKWDPVSYQVGELVKTIPLAPKEVRRFSKKVSIRKSRSEKEVENNQRSRRTESAQTVRAETEIMQKAANKTNFQLNAEGGFSIGIVDAKASTAFAQDAATDSQEAKKEFREAVFKATEEYKQERTVEVNVSTAEEASFEESGEISNPNDEITVTYLFYELQRRYRLSEQIHRITPIVLVAQEFPTPDQINEAWIIAHDWILRRVILDDSFIPAMTYLSSKVVGDENALQEMYQNLQQQRQVVEDLKGELVAISQQVGRRYAALQKSVEKRAEAIESEESEGFLSGGVEFLFGGDDTSPEALRVREDAARDAYEREARQEKELQARLERETTAVNALTETYTRELSDHLNRKTQISRLLVHVKSNIMYYMQAIWSHEPPDQRFFRLHEVLVPKLKGKMKYKLQPDPDAIPMPPDWKKPQKIVVKCELDPNLEFITLEEAADLDNLLGFKGNYMMFPLKKSNVLTDFMMVPYLDAVTGIHDPDPLGNWTLKEFLEYVCCLHKTLSKEKFEKLLPGLQKAYQQLVNAPRDGEEIIVPTDSLYIEALPGVHPILEDFKLFHRVVDVKKAQAEVRGLELENIRFAARLLAGEREDPTIEKKVVIEGGETIVQPDI